MRAFSKQTLVSKQQYNFLLIVVKSCRDCQLNTIWWTWRCRSRAKWRLVVIIIQVISKRQQMRDDGNSTWNGFRFETLYSLCKGKIPNFTGSNRKCYATIVIIRISGVLLSQCTGACERWVQSLGLRSRDRDLLLACALVHCENKAHQNWL